MAYHKGISSKKLRFDNLTIFPHIFDSYFSESILKRAQEKGLVEIHAHNIRDFSRDKHHKTDEKPFGGGAGMVMMAEPILRAVDALHLKSQISPLKVDPPLAENLKPRENKKSKTKIVILSAKGKFFNQKIAYDWAKKYDRIVLISGRYEGIDERVTKILHAEEISIGPYVLTDGDVAAMAIISSIVRLVPGVIRLESLNEESHWNLLLKKEVKAVGTKGLLPSQLFAAKNWEGEYPHYTRPEALIWKGKKYRVPKVLLSGNHKEIAAWRSRRSLP